MATINYSSRKYGDQFSFDQLVTRGDWERNENGDIIHKELNLLLKVNSDNKGYKLFDTRADNPEEEEPLMDSDWMPGSYDDFIFQLSMVIR